MTNLEIILSINAVVMAIVIAGLVCRVIFLAKDRKMYQIEMNEWIKDYMSLSELLCRSQAQAKEAMALAKQVSKIG